MAALPFLPYPYLIVWVFLFAVYLTLAVSYDIVGGYMGYMNLGHSVFFGLGAYTTAILLNQGFHVGAALAAAAAVAACFAAVTAYPIFRLRGAYFALGTFGLISLVGIVCNNLRDLTGGSGGISTPTGDHGIAAYYLSLIVAVSTLALSRGLAVSQFGPALFSIRDDEEVARSLGMPTTLCKSLALVVAAVPAGTIGGVYVWNVGYISPSSVFGLEIALSPIVMAMLGGSGTIAGPFLGVLFLTVVQELLWTKLPYLHLTVYGIIMLLVGLFMPGGLVRTRWFRSLAERFKR
ncbi:MAG: branched-chain amino acid ABC transporter permease [Pseudomonadota bacterium]